MSSTKFTAKIFRWQKQVNEDATPAAAAKVVIYLSNLFNEGEGGAAWPSCKTIADDIGLSEKTIIRIVHILEQRGHLRVEWGKPGRGHSNRYWMILKPAPAQVLEAVKPANRYRVKPASGEIKPVNRDRKTCTAMQETLSKTHRRLTEGERLSRPDDASPGKKKSLARQGITPKSEATSEAELAEAFERFWRTYPKRVAKGAARRAFAKALERASAETIIAGAKRYAGEREGEPPRYTAHPATWLNADRWQDEPEASSSGPPIIDNATGAVIEPPPRHNSHRRHDGDRYMSPEEFARSILEDMERGR